MDQKKALIKKSKVKFPNLDCNQIFKTKKAVLIDLDDTLYPYWPAHIKGLEEVLKYLKKRYSNEFISLLCSMLETNEDLRPDFEQLEKKINNFIVV